MSSCGAGFQPARRAKARLHTATLQVVESCVAVEQDHPEVIAPPPLIFFVTFMIGYLCRNFPPRAGSPPVGAAIAVIGMIIGAALSFRIISALVLLPLALILLEFGVIRRE